VNTNLNPSTVPTLAHIARHDGVVGEYSYTVEFTYPGYPTNVVRFTTGTFGNTYAVVMTTQDRTAYVSEAWRYGKLGPGWIHKYYR
jgi:hypothetical protein